MVVKRFIHRDLYSMPSVLPTMYMVRLPVQHKHSGSTNKAVYFVLTVAIGDMFSSASESINL